MVNAKRFLKSSVQYCIPSIVSAVVAIAVIPIISSIYPTDEYGKINMFYSVGNMLLYIVLLGMDSAYIRFFFEPPIGLKRKDVFALAFWTSTIIDVLLGSLVVAFFSEEIGKYLFGEKNNLLLVFLAVYVMALVLFRLFSIETRMERNALLFNFQQIILIITNRISYVVVALYSTSYQYAIVTISISTILFAMFFLLIRKKFVDYKLSILPVAKILEIYKFALPCTPTMLMTWLNNSIAKLVLSGCGDFNSVGVLTIATSLANIFSLIPSAFCVYWSPFVYANYKKEQAFIKKVHSYIMILSIGMLWGILWLQDFIYFFVSGEYKLSQPYFMLIMLTPIQTLICETTSYGISLSNKTKYNLYISIIAVIINITLGLSLYQWWGIYGVVLGIAASALFQLVAKTIIGQKYYKSIVDWKKTFVGLLIIVLIVGCNLYAYKDIVIRTVVSVITLLLFIVIYRNDIKAIIIFVGKNGKVRK